MALPTPPPFNQPIPNNPFYFPLNSTLQGDYSPFIVGSGLFINYSTGVIQATGGGGAGVSSITPGIGIAVTGGGVGDVLLSNTGVIDILAGYGITVASDGFGNYTVSTTGTLGTVTSVTAGPGLSGGTITTAGTISLPNLYATPLTTYPYPVSVSVDNFGRVAAISEGTPPLTYSLFTGKGQLIAGRGSNSAGIVPAAPDGCVLVACTACLEGMTWADPTPGPSVTLTGVAPITVAGTPTNPVIAISPATTSACGAVQLNNTVTCNSVTQALTAAQGCNLQQQINNIALCNGTVTSVTGSYPVAITGNPSVTPNITVCGAG
ncbi:MAG: hypothetical protein JRF07_03760, partial [Deltaproteobacteria bacterium]|nr:hypothetical protein [Deltaproteobacteria bacterium]